MELSEIFDRYKEPKLHLGCGNVYLPGYVNIDFPLTGHTIFDTDIADIHADITTLSFPSFSISEIRLHHVFEHFTRATALRLIIEWYEWLAEGGKLIIETPDFERCIRRVVSPFCSTQQRMKLIRHLYGSHEASWAVHLDAWDEKKFKLVLLKLGFRNLIFSSYKYLGIYSIKVVAVKLPPYYQRDIQLEKVKELLKLSLVAIVPTELKMLDFWYSEVVNGIANKPVDR